MFRRLRQFQVITTLVLITAFWLAPLRTFGQDLVAVSSITGGSVFVFRAVARGLKRLAQTVRPTRSKSQRVESAARVKKQYETGRTKRSVADPGRLASAGTLPAAQAAKIFAGVGEYYIQQKDADNAIEKLRDSLSLDKTLVEAQVGLAEALAMKGTALLEEDKNDQAKPLFQEALTNDPKNSAAYYGLGEILSDAGQTKDAIANYEKALENNPKLTEIYVPLGILYFQDGQIPKADDLLSKAIVNSPDSAETQFFLGLIRSSQGRQDEALAAFNKATAADPKYAEAFTRTGDALVALKRPQEAITAYQQAAALKDDFADTWSGLGTAYYDAGNYPESINAYTKAKKLKNDDWETYAGLGDAYLKSNSFNEAATNFNLAVTFVTRKPDYNKDTVADLYSKIGFAYGQQCPINQAKLQPCQWPASIKALEKAVEMGGKPIDYTNLGWAYFNASRIDRDEKKTADQQAKLALARTNLQKAIDANPPYLASVQQNYGAVLLDMGDYKGAVESLNKVIEKEPDWAFTHYALGSAYYMAADYNNAAAQFRTAIEKDPNYIAAYASLGTVYIKQKNNKEAKKLVEQLRAKDPRAAQQLEQQIKLSGMKLS